MYRAMSLLVAVVACSLLFGLQAGAATVPGEDTVRLTDGRIIIGKLVYFDGDVFQVEVEEETIYLKRENVASLFLGATETVEMEKVLQWATGARASSQYSDTRWSANQATGAPDTDKCGDQDTAWSPSSSSADEEWLELTFAVPVYASGLRIHETYSPGFVWRIVLIDEAGRMHTVWQGEDDTECADWLEISFERTSYPVRTVRLHTQIKGWEEVDAVQLIGYREPEAPAEEEAAAPEERQSWQAPGDDVYTVAEVLREKTAIGTRQVQVRGMARNVQQKKGIFGIEYTSFDLVGEDGRTLSVHLDDTMSGIPTQKEVIVTGNFEHLFGEFLSYFRASNVRW